MTKTLGQVAYEAFKDWIREPLHEWPRVSTDYSEAWQAVAEAVAEELAEPCPVNATYEAEYKVVEAAKAWYPTVEGIVEGPHLVMHPSLKAIRDAVEALEEVERECEALEEVERE